MMSANKSLAKKNFPLVWKCYKIWSTWEVWRALKKLELLLAMPRATLTHLLCSPNFPHASYLNECTLTYEPIVNYIICRVIDGLETLDDLEKLPVNEKTYRPLTEVRIKNVTIHANPIADKSGWINPTGKLRCKPTITYCQTRTVVCAIRPATLEGTTSQSNNSRCNRKQS